MKVFWSWQSDLAAKCNRDMIEEALRRALAALSDELELDPSEGPELDHDTKNAKGMAAIADTIFEKIKDAAIFVGDVTTVGKSDGGRELPNPNVLIELGWAWAHLTHENVILVANVHYGPKKAEKLPFDIRHRRAVVFYSLAKSADDDAIEAATAGLAHELQNAIHTSLAEWLAAVASSPGPAGNPSREGDPSVWFERDAVLQHQPYHGGGGIEQVTPAKARRLYARIISEKFRNGMPKAVEIHAFQGTHGHSGLGPMGPWTGAEGGLNGDGVLRYGFSQPGNPTTTWTATQWFRNTGELWSFDTRRLEEDRFFVGSVVRDVVAFLSRGLEMLHAFGATGRIRIEIGGVGLLGTEWAGQFKHERSDALLDRVVVSQSRRKWDEAAIDELMLAFVNEMAEAFGRPHFQVEQVRRLITG